MLQMEDIALKIKKRKHAHKRGIRIIKNAYGPLISLEIIQCAEKHKYSTMNLKSLWSWFGRLSYEDQHRVLTFTDKTWVRRLESLYWMLLSKKHENGIFVHLIQKHCTSKSGKKQKHDTFIQNTFYQGWEDIENQSSNNQDSPRSRLDFMRSSRQLFSSVRLWDADQYIDSVWIKRNGCVDSVSFRKTLNLILQYGFCSIKTSQLSKLEESNIHKGKLSNSHFEYSKVEIFSLAGYIAVRILDNLVLHYEHCTKIQQNEEMRLLIEESVLNKRLTQFCQFWGDTEYNQQQELIGGQGQRRKRIQNILSSLSQIDQLGVNQNILENSYQQVLDVLGDNLLNDAFYVAEILYTSNLSQTGTAFDLITRTIGSDVQTLLSDRIVASLLDEVSENTNTLNQPKEKPKLRKKKQKKNIKKSSQEYNIEISNDSVRNEKQKQEDINDISDTSMATYQFIHDIVVGLSDDVFHILNVKNDSDKRNKNEKVKSQYEKLEITQKGPVVPHKDSEHEKNENKFQESIEKKCREAFHHALHTDILEMSTMLEKICNHRRPRQMCVINLIRQCVSSIWPHSKLIIFGSFETGLALPNSDVDILITNVPVQEINKGKNESLVSILVNRLRNQFWIHSIHPIEQTLIPIVKLVANISHGLMMDDYDLIDIDITFEQPDHRGIETCIYVQKLMINLPELSPLVLILKQFLIKRGLNDSYTGGISSYALTLMVSSILLPFQHSSVHYRPNLGTLLIYFLESFGILFDPSLQYISTIYEGPLRSLHEKKSILSSGMDTVIIEDPLRPEQNAGKSCFRFQEVQCAFVDAFNSISLMNQEFQQYYILHHGYLHNWKLYPRSILGSFFSTHHHLQIINGLKFNLNHSLMDNNNNSFILRGNHDENLHQWSSQAYYLLQQLQGNPSQQIPCRFCGSLSSCHDNNCQVHDLILRFQYLS